MRKNGTEKNAYPPNPAIEVPSQIGQGIGPSTQMPMMMKSISMLKPLLAVVVHDPVIYLICIQYLLHQILGTGGR
jgi:hypothetical protein